MRRMEEASSAGRSGNAFESGTRGSTLDQSRNIEAPFSDRYILGTRLIALSSDENCDTRERWICASCATQSL